MQRNLANVADQLTADVEKSRDKETRARLASGIAATARAWCDLEERKRVLKMKGLPKSIDVEKAKEARRLARAAAKPREPAFVEDEPPADDRAAA